MSINAHLESQIRDLQQRVAALEFANNLIAAALSQALSCDRVFVPQNFELAEFKVERTIDNDYLIVRK